MNTQNNDTTTSTSGQQAGAFSKEDQITSLTAQALNGNTPRNRHLALVQLLTKLDAANGDKDDLVCTARDAAIKHSTGLTDVIAALLVGSPLPAASQFDETDVMPLDSRRPFVEPTITEITGARCPISWSEPKGKLGTPESVDFGSIVEFMAHKPPYRAAVLEALATIGNRDPWDIRNRACRIVDDSDTYNKATRDRVDEVYNGDDLDALIEVVTQAESGANLKPLSVGRVERLSETDSGDEDTETESTLVKELRQEIADLEAENEKLRKPWEGIRGATRRGESEVPELMDRLAIKVAVEHIADNTTGAVFTGAVLLLIEHLGRLAYDKRFNDLDMAIDDIREGLLRGSYMDDHTAETLRVATDESIREWVQYHVTSGIRELSEDFEKFNERLQRRSWSTSEA